jgi:Protein of unknown function (DUF2934)
MSDTLSTAAIATSQDETIRQRAYEIWEREGRTGNPEDHWFRAQQELDEQGQERSAATVDDAHPSMALIPAVGSGRDNSPVQEVFLTAWNVCDRVGFGEAHRATSAR